MAAGELRVGKVKILDAARHLTTAWNTALNAHDVAALEAVYAPTVGFYGRHFSRSQVIEAKRAALAAAPSFQQSLTNVRVVPWPNGGVHVEFDKTSGGKRVSGELWIEPYDAVYAIVVETDAPTKRMERAMMGCQDAMYEVAAALPEVRRVYDEAGPSARTGGLYFPDEGKNRSLSLGFHHDDRFENVFFVYWENGKFTVTYNGESLAVPPADLARVIAKCPK